MKTLVLRTCCLVVLAGASWAVWGADSPKKREFAAPVAKPTSTSSKVALATDAEEPKSTTPPVTRPSAPVATPIAPAKPALAKVAAAPTTPTVPADNAVHLSLSTLTPTPEMWFYERMRQDYNDPALQARLRGERAAAERRARLAARAWYGVSNGRPTAHVTPFTYYYSTFWGSNTRNPFMWGGTNSTQVIIEARRPATNVSGFGVW